MANRRFFLRSLPVARPVLGALGKLGRLGDEWGPTDTELSSGGDWGEAAVGSESGVWDWLGSSAGQQLTSTASQILGQSQGIQQYPAGTYGPFLPGTSPYARPALTASVSSVSPVLLIGGLALAAFLLLRK